MAKKKSKVSYTNESPIAILATDFILWHNFLSTQRPCLIILVLTTIFLLIILSKCANTTLFLSWGTLLISHVGPEGYCYMYVHVDVHVYHVNQILLCTCTCIPCGSNTATYSINVHVDQIPYRLAGYFRGVQLYFLKIEIPANAIFVEIFLSRNSWNIHPLKITRYVHGTVYAMWLEGDQILLPTYNTLRLQLFASTIFCDGREKQSKNSVLVIIWFSYVIIYQKRKT